jgi:hypothetical protein
LQRAASNLGVYGVRIEETAQKEDREFPVLVERIITEVENRNGLIETGLYRLSGSQVQIKSLKDQLNINSKTTNLTVDAVPDIHTLTGALKLYFRELPEPLIPYNCFNYFVEAASTEDESAQVTKFTSVIRSMPSVNQITVIFLFNHLQRVVKNAATNLMTLRNIATCFAPSIMAPPPPPSQGEGGGVEALSMGFDVSTQMRVVETLLKIWQKLVEFYKP